MTTQRRHGEDTPFCAWLRANPDLDSIRHSLTVNDNDLIIHKYRTKVDGLGTRGVQLQMWLELKTFGAMPNDNQRQTLFDHHQLLARKQRLLDARNPGQRRSVWHFGAFVLSLSGTTPDNSNRILWCRFDAAGALDANEVTVDQLIRILRFDVAPDWFDPIEGRLRRHHKTQQLIMVQRMPLGFDTEVLVKKSS